MHAVDVTVLMTVYDPRLDQLEAAARSILGQTYRDFEFLIIDDGGRDESVRAALDRWASNDSRVRVYHEPHRGVAASSNRGLVLARGEFVARHDSDDWSEADRLAQQVAFLKSHPEIVLAGTDTYGHFADGRGLWRFRLPHNQVEVATAISTRNPFVHGSTMFRRETALRIGGYREQFRYSEDYDFLWRLSEAGGAVNLDAVLYHYRFSGGSISAHGAAGQARAHRAAKFLADQRRKKEPEDLLLAFSAADGQLPAEEFRGTLKQADHLMLAGDFSAARAAYFGILRTRPWSVLAWAKAARLAIFCMIPPAREICFR